MVNSLLDNFPFKSLRICFVELSEDMFTHKHLHNHCTVIALLLVLFSIGATYATNFELCTVGLRRKNSVPGIFAKCETFTEGAQIFSILEVTRRHSKCVLSGYMRIYCFASTVSFSLLEFRFELSDNLKSCKPLKPHLGLHKGFWSYVTCYARTCWSNRSFIEISKQFDEVW